jgi:hypothetical protein
VADTNHQDNHVFIFDTTDGTVIADLISPKTGERRFQGFAKGTGI